MLFCALIVLYQLITCLSFCKGLPPHITKAFKHCNSYSNSYSNSYININSNSRSTNRKIKGIVLQSTLNDNSNSNSGDDDDDDDDDDRTRIKKVIYDSSVVDSILAKVKSTLAPYSLESGAETSVEELQKQFEKIFNDVRSSSFSDNEKNVIFAESRLLLEDAKFGPTTTTDKQLPTLSINKPITSLFSSSNQPLVLVHGSGKVSEKLLQRVTELGKAIDCRLIDAKFLSVVQESELKYQLRNARSIVIAADSPETIEKSGWFGVSGDTDKTIINEKGLKRLLNAAMADVGKRTDKSEIKVVALGKATKQKKSVASFLGGDTTDFDDEVILQCEKRKLPFTIVKVGKVIGDSDPFPADVRDRSDLKSSIEDNSAQTVPDYTSPMIITHSKVIEYTECTRLSVATEALLRASTHPHRNATFAILSTSTNNQPTESNWNHEFLRVDGPELARIPLLYASPRQAISTLTRLVAELEKKSSGLVTPIEVEKFSNGIRIIFRPLESSYKSAKEEKEDQEKLQQHEEQQRKLKRPSGYMSPEDEKKFEQSTQELQQSVATVTKGPSKKKSKPEGGLEIIVDKEPYHRVRVKRCNMGPETIVKLESEGIIMRAISKGVQRLDKDYKVLLTTDKAALWSTPKI